MPLRLHGALLQHSAGRRSLAAMSAEEHVEPCAGLSERREGRRSAAAPKAESAPAAKKPPEPRLRGRQAQEPLNPKLPRRRRPRRRSSRPARRSPRSAAPAAPIIQKSARACRPAAHRRCNAWKRTRPNSRPVARRPSPRRPAAQQRRRRSGARGWRGSGCRGAAAAAPAAPVVIVLRPMRPREELFVLRSACGGDVRTICGGVAPGGGRIVQCLATNAAQLSPACQDVLSQFRAQ